MYSILHRFPCTHTCCTALHCIMSCFMCNRDWPGICIMFHFHCQNYFSGLHVQLSGIITSNLTTRMPFAVTFIEENFLFRNRKPFKFVLLLITPCCNNASFAVAETIKFPSVCFHASVHKCPDMFSCTFINCRADQIFHLWISSD